MYTNLSKILTLLLVFIESLHHSYCYKLNYFKLFLKRYDATEVEKKTISLKHSIFLFYYFNLSYKTLTFLIKLNFLKTYF